MTLPVKVDLDMGQEDLLVKFFVHTSDGSVLRRKHTHAHGTDSITSIVDAGGNNVSSY